MEIWKRRLIETMNQSVTEWRFGFTTPLHQGVNAKAQSHRVVWDA